MRSLNAASVSREWPLHLSDLFGGHMTPEEFSPLLPSFVERSLFRGSQRVRARGEGEIERRQREI